jgi:RimJ/RimL family protein N-acetyltransferase
MSSDVVRAILRRDWPAATRLLGTEFPLEWREDGWRWLEPQADHGEHDDRYITWGTRLAFATSDVEAQGRGAVLAEVGFHGPPDTEGWVEIGYRVVAKYRRQGLAQEAALALLRWATGHGVSGVKASVSPHNAASIGLLDKLGFINAGRYEHRSLGEQLIYRRKLRRSSRGYYPSTCWAGRAVSPDLISAQPV